MLNRLVTILLFALALGIAFDYLFYDQLLGVNYPLWIGIFMAGLLLLFPDRVVSADRRTGLFFGGSFLFAVMVFVRESDLLTVLNVLASLGLLALGIEALALRPVRRYAAVDYVLTTLLPLKCFPYFFSGMEELTALGAAAEKRSNLARVLKGLLIALPIIGVLIVLFSSADLVFRKYVMDLIRFDSSAATLAAFLRVGFVTGVAFAVCMYIVRSVTRSVSPTPVPTKASESSFGAIETSVILGSVSAVFLVFLAIQFTYLFGGEGAIAAQGFAYAEYARRGFFELIAVSLISFLLLLTTARQVTRNGAKHLSVFKWLAAVLILETVLVMASAFQRLSLYELAYGFTTLRLYSHIFIAWIGTIFLLLGYEIFVREDRVAFALRGLVSMVVFLLVVNALNPDQFIARQNIERYHATGEIDFNYLSTLSTDSFPETVKLLDDASVREQAFHSLQLVYPDDTGSYQNLLNSYVRNFEKLRQNWGWPSVHLSRQRGQEIYKSREVGIQEALTEPKTKE